MSTDHTPSRTTGTDTEPLPTVPNVADPTPSNRVTDDFEPGTANDPDVGTREEVQITVDGASVSVHEGDTVYDAIASVGDAEDVPALCNYEADTEDADRIGPRSECRTCVVETDAHGMVPSCSFPAEEGLTVRTDTEEATRTREVNLDLVLSDHNLRCTTCGQNGRCELQDASIEQDVEDPRYGVFDDREEYEPIDDSSPFIQIDRNKCILCNRCVEACNDVQVEGVLRIEGSGPDTRIAFQNGAETMMDSTCVSCGHCATVCPTGALVEQGLTDVATIPLPGFNQKNSIGTVVGEDYERQSRQMTPMKKDERPNLSEDE